MDEKVIQEIVRQILAAKGLQSAPAEPKKEAPQASDEFPIIPVGVSARHVHLSRKDMDTLFGPGSELTPIKPLMGGQYAAKEQVTIIGPSLRSIERVRVLGPLRKQSQVEISATDSFVLKVKPPVRPSGDLKGSAGITIVGPKGVVKLEEGCIIANRHIHMSPEDAKRFGVKDGDYVNTLAEGERRTMLYGVQIRVSPEYTLEMHIDTDDANAIGFKDKTEVTMFKR
ncbi:MAG: phosphate propanoyltransferase [Ruminococcaceae bacterium]|nr:phosphate propanoyltransferase [Oscillospiraceae bacterium]HHV32656.1 phosphate propanoyltransferase [Clostridiales bacterium]